MERCLFMADKQCLQIIHMLIFFESLSTYVLQISCVFLGTENQLYNLFRKLLEITIIIFATR